MKKLLLAMMFVLIAVSCGGDDETMEEAAERYAKVMCKKIFACEETSAYEAFVGGTESACVTLMTAEPEEEEGEETTETEECENPNFDKVNECISCYENMSCEDFAEAMQSDEEACPACDETCND